MKKADHGPTLAAMADETGQKSRPYLRRLDGHRLIRFSPR
jgi:hypothetical protein